MGKGSKRRNEDADRVRSNWPFPQKPKPKKDK